MKLEKITKNYDYWLKTENEKDEKILEKLVKDIYITEFSSKPIKVKNVVIGSRNRKSVIIRIEFTTKLHDK